MAQATGIVTPGNGIALRVYCHRAVRLDSGFAEATIIAHEWQVWIHQRDAADMIVMFQVIDAIKQAVCTAAGIFAARRMNDRDVRALKVLLNAVFFSFGQSLFDRVIGQLRQGVRTRLHGVHPMNGRWHSLHRRAREQMCKAGHVER